MRCEHGNEIGGTQLPSGGWMGGVGHCRCCKSSYGYINSATYGQDGLIQSKTFETHGSIPLQKTATGMSIQ